mmetsp:Transcript_19255/g.32137  ORF Transcript_19255/g.32137 Transcript_19255/m.32137 type:complete len:117 (-) Transcript_19255:2318-2668(-)
MFKLSTRLIAENAARNDFFPSNDQVAHKFHESHDLSSNFTLPRMDIILPADNPGDRGMYEVSRRIFVMHSSELLPVCNECLCIHVEERSPSKVQVGIHSFVKQASLGCWQHAYHLN